MKKSLFVLLACIGSFLTCPEIVNAQIMIRRQTTIKVYPSRLGSYQPYRTRNRSISAQRSHDFSVLISEEIQIQGQRPREVYYADDSFRSADNRIVSQIASSDSNLSNQNIRGNSVNNAEFSRIEKTLSDIDRRVGSLEKKVAVNAHSIEEIKDLKKDILELKSLLLEFKEKNLR